MYSSDHPALDTTGPELQPPAASVSKRRDWTTLEVRLLKQLYPDLPNSRVARQLNRSVSSISSKANGLGLHKSEAFFRSAAAHRFTAKSSTVARTKKCHAPHNKDQEYAHAQR